MNNVFLDIKNCMYCIVFFDSLISMGDFLLVVFPML